MLETPVVIVATLCTLFIAIILIIFQKNRKNTTQKIELLESEILELNETVNLQTKEINTLEKKSKKTSYASEQINKIQELKNELEKQKRRVQEAKSIAQEANMVKYDFLTNVSHEIRTPMNSILVFAELLSNELSQKKFVSYADNIFHSGHKLLRLLDDVIELSKLESGNFKLQEGAVDIHNLFESIVEEKKSVARSKGLKLLLEIDDKVPLSLICDAKKLTDIISHLVDNGLKFTQVGFVKVKVKVQKENLKNNNVDLLIYVEDSGIGISKESKESIFKIFQKREGSTELELQGTGIGLSINQKMASLMNGTLSVESKLGVGSRFIFLIRALEVVLVSASDERVEQRVDFSLVCPKGANVMVIDEDEESHKAINDAFKLSSVKVFNYRDPRDAVAKLKESKIDLIFIDVDIFSVDENAFSKVIAMMSSAAVVTLTQGNIKNIAFSDAGARVAGHLKRPISKVELFKLSIKELNSSPLSVIAQLKKTTHKTSVEPLSKEQVKSFLIEHKKEIVGLFQNAQASNDLNAIKLFAQKLLSLSKKIKIKMLVSYSEDLLEHIEHFEIDEINSMMNEYKSKIKSLQSL